MTSRSPERSAGNPTANVPTFTHSNRRWKNDLTDDEQQTILTYCGDLLKQLGYV